MAARPGEPAAAGNGTSPDNRKCAGCGQTMPDSERPEARYCARKCKNTAAKRRARKTSTGPAP